MTLEFIPLPPGGDDPGFRFPTLDDARFHFFPVGTPATTTNLADALAAYGLPGVTAQTALFLLLVYGGPDAAAQGKTVQELISAMIEDGSLVIPQGGGAQLDLSAIDGKRIADAIFRDAGIDPATGALDAHLLDFGIDILTNNPNAHSAVDAVTQIRMFGSGGVISADQLAELINQGGLGFGQTPDQLAIAVSVRTDHAGPGLFGREAPYLLSFDTTGDGALGWEEFQAGLASNLYENQTIDPGMAQMLWHFYGTDVNGTWAITADGIAAMKADGVLRDWANTDGSAGFAISLASINPDRFAQGLLRYDADGSGDLTPEELSAALAPYAAAGTRVDPAITRRLGILYGGAHGIEADGLKAMLAEGVLVPAVGPGGAETAGYRINLDAVPTQRVVDRMFLYLGMDPASGTMTTAQFETALDFVTGDVDPVNGDAAAYLGTMRGTPDGVGGHTFTRDQLLSIFTSGAITRKPAGDLDIIAIQSNVNVSVPKHHHGHWWDSIFKFFKDEAKDIVSTIAQITGIAESVIADIFNGKLSVTEALAQGGGQIITAIVGALQRGDERAHALIDQLGTALMSELKDLGAEGRKLIGDLVAEAKATGEEMAVKTLTALSGMTAEQAHDFVTRMASKGALVDFAKNLTYDDMRTLIPDFDAVMAGLENVADTFMQNAANDPSARRTLQAAGFSFDAAGNLKQGARVLSAEDKRDVWAKYFRADAAVELNTGLTNGLQFNGLQVRVFVCYTGRDANGNRTMQLRFRVLDEAGAAGSKGKVNGDAGMISVHDLVLNWSLPTGEPPIKGDIKWNSTLGFIGEIDAGASLFEYFWTPAEGPNPPPAPATWNADLLDGETGVGVGWTVSYDLTKMGNAWWTPFASELAGLIVGGAGTAGALILGETIAPEFFTGILAKAGVTMINGGAMLTSFLADVIYAKADHNADKVSGEGGFFWWAALRGGLPKWSGDLPQGKGSAQLRLRFQINASSAPTVTF